MGCKGRDQSGFFIKNLSKFAIICQKVLAKCQKGMYNDIMIL